MKSCVFFIICRADHYNAGGDNVFVQYVNVIYVYYLLYVLIITEIVAAGFEFCDVDMACAFR